jgi:3-oxoadipate enol-lactonase
MRFKLKSGSSLRYATRGRGRTIVCLHPVGLRAEFWGPVVARLEHAFRLVCVDTRGHGESDAPATPFSMDDCADDVIELSQAIGRPPAVFVGCSMGGMIAQGVAVRAPDLVAGVVVANTAHKRNDQGRAVMTARARQALDGMPTVVDSTLERWFDDAALSADPELATQARAWLLDADPVVHSWSWEAIRDLNYAEALLKLDRPFLGIAGARDRSTPSEAVRAMVADIPNGRFCELDTGHLGPLENPSAFADTVRSFVEGL